MPSSFSQHNVDFPLAAAMSSEIVPRQDQTIHQTSNYSPSFRYTKSHFTLEPNLIAAPRSRHPHNHQRKRVKAAAPSNSTQTTAEVATKFDENGSRVESWRSLLDFAEPSYSASPSSSSARTTTASLVSAAILQNHPSSQSIKSQQASPAQLGKEQQQPAVNRGASSNWSFHEEEEVEAASSSKKPSSLATASSAETTRIATTTHGEHDPAPLPPSSSSSSSAGVIEQSGSCVPVPDPSILAVASGGGGGGRTESTRGRSRRIKPVRASSRTLQGALALAVDLFALEGGGSVGVSQTSSPSAAFESDEDGHISAAEVVACRQGRGLEDRVGRVISDDVDVTWSKWRKSGDDRSTEVIIDVVDLEAEARRQVELEGDGERRYQYSPAHQITRSPKFPSLSPIPAPSSTATTTTTTTIAKAKVDISSSSEASTTITTSSPPIDLPSLVPIMSRLPLPVRSSSPFVAPSSSSEEHDHDDDEYGDDQESGYYLRRRLRLCHRGHQNEADLADSQLNLPLPPPPSSSTSPPSSSSDDDSSKTSKSSEMDDDRSNPSHALSHSSSVLYSRSRLPTIDTSSIALWKALHAFRAITAEYAGEFESTGSKSSKLNSSTIASSKSTSQTFNIKQASASRCPFAAFTAAAATAAPAGASSALFASSSVSQDDYDDVEADVTATNSAHPTGDSSSAAAAIVAGAPTACPFASSAFLKPASDPTSSLFPPSSASDIATAAPESALSNLLRAFNWSSLVLPIESEGEWYGVCFRSVRRPQDKSSLATLDSDLYAADNLSHEEAISSGGLLMYWYGSPSHQPLTGANLATCLWLSREDAIKASRLPMHKRATKMAGMAYERFELARYRVRKVKGEARLRLEDW